MEKLSRKRLFMLTFGIMMSFVVFGQQVRVSGTVTDAADRSTLPGVNVVVKGTLTGTITGIKRRILPAGSARGCSCLHLYRLPSAGGGCR